MVRFAVSRPVSTGIGAATLVVLGLVSLSRLPVALLPELERPAIVITAEAEAREAGATRRTSVKAAASWDAAIAAVNAERAAGAVIVDRARR